MSIADAAGTSSSTETYEVEGKIERRAVRFERKTATKYAEPNEEFFNYTAADASSLQSSLIKMR